LSNPSTRMARYKVWVIPISRLSPMRLGQRLFAEPDRQAQRYGWQVSVIRGGLGRRYHDPRFDRFSAPARGPDPEVLGHA